jgi:hypothetical protein|tara:strand:+ start:5201 stop:5470 length:270 start_codon:yes stop_codon:yes gene_type:complete
MSQYNNRVEKQRLKIEAEEWAKGVKSVHAHSMDSLWYDDRPQDTQDGKSVFDIHYNDDSVRRTTSTNETIIMGNSISGQELIDNYIRNK